MAYQNDRKRGDFYLPGAIRGLEKRGFKDVSIAPDDVDMNEAADIIADYEGKKLTIAFRMRDIKYFNKFGNEFTLRYRRSSKQKTEYEKIIAGYGDLMLYGFGDDQGNIVKYVLFNLNGLRSRVFQMGGVSMREKSNTGGETFFVWFRWSELPSNCLIDSNYIDESQMMSEGIMKWLDDYVEALEENL